MDNYDIHTCHDGTLMHDDGVTGTLMHGIHAHSDDFDLDSRSQWLGRGRNSLVFFNRLIFGFYFL